MSHQDNIFIYTREVEDTISYYKKLVSTSDETNPEYYKTLLMDGCSDIVQISDTYIKKSSNEKFKEQIRDSNRELLTQYGEFIRPYIHRES